MTRRPAPHEVTVECDNDACRESLLVSEGTAEMRSMHGHTIYCERCEAAGATDCDSWAYCSECDRKTPQRDYSNPGAAWSYCGWCDSKTYEA